MPRSPVLISVSVVAALAMAACSPSTEGPDEGTAEPVPPAPSREAPAAPDAPATLAAYRWHLESATDAQGDRVEALFPGPDAVLVFQFSDGRLSVRGGCNTLSAGYELDGQGRLATTQAASTRMACEPALMRADDAVGELLGGEPMPVQASGGDNARLQLTSAGGTVLVLRGEPTAQTRYGGPGERMFLEVASQRVACNHPLIPDFQCLHAREVHFDEDGLRAGEPGEWQPLYEEIEGFTHTPGTRNVLRVYRHTRQAPPADASSIVFVLDMVVESETVQP